MATPVEAPMVGKILQVLVKVGDQVTAVIKSTEVLIAK